MIDKEKERLNMKVQWIKFAVVTVLYLAFLIMTLISPRKSSGSGGCMPSVPSSL